MKPDADASAPTRLQELLTRPDDQRLREYKYRFSQSVVFGLPVIALQFFGPLLGPSDSDRWVSLLQALLAGWIVYVNLGMLAEGLILLGGARWPRVELLVVALALGLYLYSLASATVGIVSGRLWYRPILFHLCVALLAGWTGWCWWRWHARRRRAIGSVVAP